MDIIPQSYHELLDNSSLAAKKGMLNILLDRIKADESAATQSELGSFIDYIPDFIPDNDFLLPVLEAELNSMLSQYSSKVTSQWVAMDQQPYTFGHKTYNASHFSEYPGLFKLLQAVIKHPSSSGDLNSCLVNRYSSHLVAGRLHADDEDNISDLSSVITVSIGAERTIDFAKDSKSPVIKTLTLQPNSAFVMRPGCQQLLKHRLNRGQPGSGIRFSISFRSAVVVPQCNVPVYVIPNSRTSKASSDNSAASEKSCEQGAREPLVLIAGDSLARDLKPHLLGKKRVAVENICEGGSWINQTENKIVEFSQSMDPKYRVEKVFLSVDANDIRYCYSRGIRHLKAPLRRLIQKVYELFPGAKIYFQSLLPFFEVNPWTVSNVLGYNALLKECCYEHKAFYINVFKVFLDNDGNRNNFLFKDSVHPRDKAVGLIARRYIDIIHPVARGFDPERF